MRRTLVMTVPLGLLITFGLAASLNALHTQRPSEPSPTIFEPIVIVTDGSRVLGPPTGGEVLPIEQLDALTLSDPTAHDLDLIKRTGVITMTREPNYLVILSDKSRAHVLRSSGLKLIPTQETDYRLRTVCIQVPTDARLSRAMTLIADPWPGAAAPGILHGGAYDSQIVQLASEGYKLSICGARDAPQLR